MLETQSVGQICNICNTCMHLFPQRHSHYMKPKDGFRFSTDQTGFGKACSCPNKKLPHKPIDKGPALMPLKIFPIKGSLCHQCMYAVTKL